jgi:hypothetical protein
MTIRISSKSVSICVLICELRIVDSKTEVVLLGSVDIGLGVNDCWPQVLICCTNDNRSVLLET